MFYAYEHHYSKDIRDEHGHRIGKVEQFGTKAERDAWVAADEDHKREAITSREAKQEIVMVFGKANIPEGTPMEKLAAEYKRYIKEGF